MRTTVSAHIPKKPVRHLDYNLSLIFNSLRDIVRVYEENLDVKADCEFHYEVWTDRGYRVRSSRPRSKKGVEFASIIAFKKYVAFYFLPLSTTEVVTNNTRTELMTCNTGLYTFHFETLSPIITKQLEELVKQGWMSYKREGLIHENN